MKWFGRKYIIDQIKFHRNHANDWLLLAKHWPERSAQYRADAKRNRDTARRLIKELRWKDEDHARTA